jgi:ABC-2 type transport system ATP-binding protein
MTDTTAEIAIDVDGLEKTYAGDVHAVRGISFDVPAGEVFGLLGPNGAGKSTTVGMLTTTIRPTGGSARLVGFDVAMQSLAARAVSSVVFQEAVVDRALSGRRHLELHARLWGVDPREASDRIGDLVDVLHLADLIDRAVATYSGGERRRVEIARALVSRPRVLFLDEPTVGLDPRIRAELLDAIATLRDGAATTILLTTHYLEEAERLCDRVAVMHRGEVVAIGAPQQLRAELGDQVVELRTRDDGAAVLGLLRDQGLAGAAAFTVGATVTIPLGGRSAAEVIAAIEATQVRTVSVTSRESTLDDVYLHLTGGELADAA